MYILRRVLLSVGALAENFCWSAPNHSIWSIMTDGCTSSSSLYEHTKDSPLPSGHFVLPATRASPVTPPLSPSAFHVAGRRLRRPSSSLAPPMQQLRPPVAAPRGDAALPCRRPQLLDVAAPLVEKRLAITFVGGAPFSINANTILFQMMLASA